MRKLTNYRTLLAAGLLLATTGATCATTSNDPLNDPDVQLALRAMGTASTWYHPDLFGEFAGMRYYAHHHYKGAMKYFKIGAYYSDKLSQLSIGLMYLNGEGTKKDAVTAYAWLRVAAERKYPEFVATRDGVKATLSPAQLQQSDAIYSKLEARYGDAVAKHRLIVQLRQGQMQITGSHTGFDSGISQLNTGNCSGPTIYVGGAAMAKAGCGGASMYAKYRWDPKQYFASRDAQWTATVSVGAMTEVGQAKKASSAAKQSPEKPTAEGKTPQPKQHK